MTREQYSLCTWYKKLPQRVTNNNHSGGTPHRYDPCKRSFLLLWQQAFQRAWKIDRLVLILDQMRTVPREAALRKSPCSLTLFCPSWRHLLLPRLSPHLFALHIEQPNLLLYDILECPWEQVPVQVVLYWYRITNVLGCNSCLPNNSSSAITVYCGDSLAHRRVATKSSS